MIAGEARGATRPPRPAPAPTPPPPPPPSPPGGEQVALTCGRRHPAAGEQRGEAARPRSSAACRPRLRASRLRAAASRSGTCARPRGRPPSQVRAPRPGPRTLARSRGRGAPPPHAPHPARAGAAVEGLFVCAAKTEMPDGGAPSSRPVRGWGRAPRSAATSAQPPPPPPRAQPFPLPTAAPPPAAPPPPPRSPALRGSRAAAHGRPAAGRAPHARPRLGARLLRGGCRRGSRAERCPAHAEAGAAAAGRGEGGGRGRAAGEGTGREGRRARICSRGPGRRRPGSRNGNASSRGAPCAQPARTVAHQRGNAAGTLTPRLLQRRRAGAFLGGTECRSLSLEMRDHKTPSPKGFPDSP